MEPSPDGSVVAVVWLLYVCDELGYTEPPVECEADPAVLVDEDAVLVDEDAVLVDEDAVLVDEDAAVVLCVQLSMGAEFTLTPDCVPLFETLKTVQKSLRDIFMNWLTAFWDSLMVKVDV